MALLEKDQVDHILNSQERLESNRTAPIRLDAVLEKCIFYMFSMYARGAPRDVRDGRQPTSTTSSAN